MLVCCTHQLVSTHQLIIYIRYNSQCHPSPFPPPNRPWCVMFPFLCPSDLIVQFPPMSENMRCFFVLVTVSSEWWFPASSMSLQRTWTHPFLWSIVFHGVYVPRWCAAPINSSFTLGISPNAIPPPRPPHNRTWCVMLPFQRPSDLIVQFLPMSENLRCLVFCPCDSLLRMMVSSCIHVPTKDTNSSFFMAA